MNGKGDMGSVGGGHATSRLSATEEDGRHRAVREILAGWHLDRTGNADLLPMLGLTLWPRGVAE